MTALKANVVLRHLRHLVAEQEGRRQTDPELLERFVNRNDEAAFAALVARHGPVVLSVCRSVLRHQQDAEDAFQATFLVLVRKAAAIRNRAALGSWLHGVALRLARKARVSAVDRDRRERAAGQGSPVVAPDDLTWREVRKVLHEEVERLPEKFRLPLLLCYWEGQTHEEAARQLGCPKGTLKDRVERARELLRSRLVRRGLAPSTALLAASLSQGGASAGLVQATTRAALLFAAGKTAAVSARAVLLAEGIPQAVSMTKLKLGMILVLALGCLTAGTGLTALPTGTAEAKPAHSEKETAEKADRHGDALPAGAIARLGTARFRHGQDVQRIAYSPDGRLLASACGDEAVYLWDAATGREIRRFANETAGFGVAFSPDGKKLASGLLGEIRLLDPATGKHLAEWKFPRQLVRCLVFSPDGKTLAAIEQTDSTVHYLNAETGEELYHLPGPKGSYEASSFAFAPDSKSFVHATHDATEFRLRETATGKELGVFKGHEKEIRAVAFSSDGKTLASCGLDDTVRLWDIASGKTLQCMRHDHGPAALAFSLDGKTLVAARTGLSFWEVPTGKKVLEFEGANDLTVDFLAFSPDGKTLAASCRHSHMIHLWDTATGKQCGQSQGHQRAVHTVAFLPDGKGLVTGSNEAGRSPGSAIITWEPATGKELRRTERIHQCSAFAVSPDGKTLATSDGSEVVGRICLRERTSGKKVSVIKGHPGAIYSLAFSADGKRLASRESGADQMVRVWDLATAKEVCRIEDNLGGSGQVALSPDGTLVAGAGGQLVLWDVGTGKVRHLFASVIDDFHPIAFSPDGKLLAEGVPRRVRLWDVTTGEERGCFEGHKGQVRFVAFSPDGRTLASGGEDGTVRLWEVATGKERCRFNSGQTGICSGAFSADGRMVTSGAQDTTVLVWDMTGRLKDGRLIRSELSEKEREAAWADLISEDGTRIHKAIWSLAAAPDTAVPFLQAHLRQLRQPVDAKRIRQLIQELDEDDFETRQKATRELEELGEAAEGPVREALKGKPSLEARSRLEQLLAKLNRLSLQQLRVLRAIEVLEQIGTPEARQVLEALVKDMPTARLGMEAKASLERLAKRPRG
jgi:RNA polymerase sigma factor (sigma-70 family)